MFNLGPLELIVGIGSNSYDSADRIREAKSRLRLEDGLRLKRVSALYESDALLPPGAPADWNLPYLNAACLLELSPERSNHSPERIANELLLILKRIEREMGRNEASRWAPRIIDLDLLVWGFPDLSLPSIQIPHAGLMERPFALLPALDCVADRSTANLAWKYSHPEQIPQRTRISSHFWPKLAGILNLSPDSFSDGRADISELAIEAAVRELCAAGAQVIDIGAESTRPGATPVRWTDELARLKEVLPLMSRLRSELGFKLSLDTRNPETAERALEEFPLDWLNDVQGFSDDRMLKIASRSNCKLVAMHSLGVPPRADTVIDVGIDPVQAVIEWGKSLIARMESTGVHRERLILDPGIGFGKTAAQNIALIERAQEYSELGTEILIGHSRKRFLDPEQKSPAAERDLETAVLTARLSRSGVDYLRVHDVPSQSRALRLGARLAQR